MIPISRYMTPITHTVSSGDLSTLARDLMKEHGLHHLAVLDDQVLVGVVSDRDLVRSRAYDDHVVDAMMTDVTKVRDDEALESIVALMTEQHLAAVVVMNATGLAGIFTLTDAMRIFGEMLREPRPPE